MANFIHKTTLIYEKSRDQSEIPSSGDWIKNPTFNPDEATILALPNRYRKLDGSEVQEKNTSEKATADAELASAQAPNTERLVDNAITPTNSLIQDLNISSESAGLDIVTKGTGILELNSTIIADLDDTKFVQILLIQNSSDKSVSFKSREKTTGSYPALGGSEVQATEVAEYSVPSKGTELTKIS